ncbi:Stc1 domain-containing protein [Bombardia bombarda]|uniref:Stc1 domain-containing protein n=1 Tax=Bombardia bombarda TaxID=252184 RepID=A0AA40CDP1_9PEZI|nr:Stc1 domain-containing protein [Bombardia bombarda]
MARFRQSQERNTQPQIRPGAAGGTKIQCCVGNEWKTRDQFSKNKLQDYDRRFGRGATPANSGIACRAHTGGVSLELQCEGPCDRILSIDSFSKSSRRNNKNWCMECTEWQLCSEVGETLPPPMGQLAVDERTPFDAPLVATAGNLTDDMIFNKGRVAPSNEDRGNETKLQKPASSAGFGSRGGIESKILPHSLKSGQSGWSTPVKVQNGFLPPSLVSDWPTPVKNTLEGTATISRDSYDFEFDGEDTDESVSGKDVDDLATVSSDSRPDSVSTIIATKPAAKPLGRNFAPVPFNAFGPNGERCVMVKDRTVASDASSTVGVTTSKPEKVGKGGWAKPSQRKTTPQLPSYLRDMAANPQVQATTRRGRHYDGESDDEL